MTTLAHAARTCFIAWACVAVAMVAGCASNTTRITGAWVNPEAGGRPPAHKVLVVGVNRDSTARRIYEDAIVAQLVARGVAARPSYPLLPEVDAGPPPDIEMTVRKAGVDAVLVSRTLGVRTDIRVTPGHSYGPAGFYGMWGGAYSTPPNVYTVQKVEVETRLFAVEGLSLLWSGSSTTQPSGSMQQTISDFATVLVKALADAKLVA